MAWSDDPYCKTCGRQLPQSFQGFEICPWCLYYAELHNETRPRSKPPSYKSPIRALNEKHGY